MAKVISLLLAVFTVGMLDAQSISSSVPQKVDPGGSYLFYLHGGIVQSQGLPAESPYYGRYEYLAILDSFRANGFNVVSEVRPKDTKEVSYAAKVSAQIDTLLNSGVPQTQISVVGASLGAYMVMELAITFPRRNINYVLIGLCGEYAIKRYQPARAKLIGRFLSIYEISDSKNSCSQIFDGMSGTLSFDEIKTDTGLDHGFLYQPYDDWVIPVVAWITLL